MEPVRAPLRRRFEQERRRAAFLAFLPMAGVGIIATDTWVDHWLGALGGLALGGLGYAVVYAYETVMWRLHHG
ncbi:MAG: hypothetical protein IT304_06370 [Dehalococcoidia bacterium]|nr:hypothetical protein [Dehalococcoidia bacterium]